VPWVLRAKKWHRGGDGGGGAAHAPGAHSHPHHRPTQVTFRCRPHRVQKSNGQIKIFRHEAVPLSKPFLQALADMGPNLVALRLEKDCAFTPLSLNTLSPSS
jgi:hypothetical protein